MNIKAKLKEALMNETGCGIQHTGWSCNKCFFTLMDDLGVKENQQMQYWHAVLITRGDYTPKQIAKYNNTKPMPDQTRLKLVNDLLKILK